MTSYNFIFMDKEVSNTNFNRTRINDLLDKCLKKPLVTVIAGTGYGKTLTISNYLAKSKNKIVWVKLQKLDNINSRFWKHFVDSIFSNDTEMHSRLISLGFPSSLSSFHICLHMFAEVMDQNKKYTIVFDDFYLIEEKEIQMFIEKLVMAKLINLSIIILIRNLDNFRFAKVCSDEVIAHITETDLQFSTLEIDDYFKLLGYNLNKSEILNIQNYTGGLAFAIYLIGLAFSKNDISLEKPLFSAKSSIDYLIDKEVFSPCSYQLQNFLIKLSFLDSMHFGLLNEIAGNNKLLLSELLNTSSFITFNNYSKEYRIHNIFLDFLKEKQSFLGNDEVLEIKTIAANWYKNNGYIVDAMNYYKQCNNNNELLKIIIEQKSRCSKKLADVFIATIDEFPEQFVEKNPILYAVRTKFLLNNAEISEAYEYTTIKRVELESLIQDENLDQKFLREALGELYIVMAFISALMHNYDFIGLFKMADKLLPNCSQVVDYTTELNGGNIVALVGEDNSNQFPTVVKSLFLVSPYSTRVMNGCGMGFDYLSATEMNYNMGDFKNAEKNVYQAIYNSQKTQQNDIEIMSYFFLLRIASHRGQYSVAIDFIKTLKSKALKVQSSTCLSMIDLATSWFYGTIGDISKVSSWILNTDEDELESKNLAPISIGVNHFIRGRCFLEQGRYSELLLLLQNNEKLVGVNYFLIGLMTFEVLKSVCFFHIGKINEALSAFEKAYTLSSDSMLIMPFLEFSKYIKPILLLERENESSIIPQEWLNNIYLESSAYVKHLNHFIDEHNSYIYKEKTKQVYLTPQEIQILNHLCQGFSREQLSIKNNLTPNTVKNTIKAIYTKLNVTNSVDAIKAATVMQLYDVNKSTI